MNPNIQPRKPRNNRDRRDSEALPDRMAATDSQAAHDCLELWLFCPHCDASLCTLPGCAIKSLKHTWSSWRPEEAEDGTLQVALVGDDLGCALEVDSHTQRVYSPACAICEQSWWISGKYYPRYCGSPSRIVIYVCNDGADADAGGSRSLFWSLAATKASGLSRAQALLQCGAGNVLDACTKRRKRTARLFAGWEAKLNLHEFRSECSDEELHAWYKQPALMLEDLEVAAAIEEWLWHIYDDCHQHKRTDTCTRLLQAFKGECSEVVKGVNGFAQTTIMHGLGRVLFEASNRMDQVELKRKWVPGLEALDDRLCPHRVDKKADELLSSRLLDRKKIYEYSDRLGKIFFPSYWCPGKGRLSAETIRNAHDSLFNDDVDGSFGKDAAAAVAATDDDDDDDNCPERMLEQLMRRIVESGVQHIRTEEEACEPPKLVRTTSSSRRTVDTKHVVRARVYLALCQPKPTGAALWAALGGQCTPVPGPVVSGTVSNLDHALLDFTTDNRMVEFALDSACCMLYRTPELAGEVCSFVVSRYAEAMSRTGCGQWWMGEYHKYYDRYDGDFACKLDLHMKSHASGLLQAGVLLHSLLAPNRPRGWVKVVCGKSKSTCMQYITNLLRAAHVPVERLNDACLRVNPDCDAIADGSSGGGSVLWARMAEWGSERFDAKYRDHVVQIAAEAKQRAPLKHPKVWRLPSEEDEEDEHRCA